MKRILIAITISFLALSCTQSAVLSVTTDINEMQYGPEGGSFNTILFTNGSSWTATCDDETVTVSPASGAYSAPLHIEVGVNTEHRTKVIPIEIKSTLGTSTSTYKVVVTQACSPFVICDVAAKEVGAEGGIVRFTVNSNVGWTLYRTLLNGADAQLPVSPASYGKNNVDVSVTVPANDSGSRRVWSVLLALTSAPQTEACRLTIIQE